MLLGVLVLFFAVEAGGAWKPAPETQTYCVGSGSALAAALEGAASLSSTRCATCGGNLRGVADVEAAAVAAEASASGSEAAVGATAVASVSSSVVQHSSPP